MSVGSRPVDSSPVTETTTGDAAGFTIRRFSARRPLHPAEDRWLRAGLAVALPDLRMAELFAVRPDLFLATEHLVVCVERLTGRPVAALGASWSTTAAGTRFLHIGIQFVSSRLRRGSVFSTSWLALLDDVVTDSGEFPRLSALRTYNPVAYCAMRAYGRLPGAVLYPDVELARQDDDAGRSAADIAAVLAPSAPFDLQSGRLGGIGVPRDLYRTRPRCDDQLVNEHFVRHTEPGDRILCVVDVRSPETEQAIMSGFRRRSHRPVPGSPVPTTSPGGQHV